MAQSIETLNTAVDYAGKHDDWTTECYFSYDDKGSVIIHDIQRYKHTINHDNQPTRHPLPDGVDRGVGTGVWWVCLVRRSFYGNSPMWCSARSVGCPDRVQTLLQNPRLHGLGFSVDWCNTVLIYAGRGVLWVNVDGERR